MRNWFCILAVAMLPLQLGGCYKNGSSASPPDAFTATAGDSRVVLNWTASPGVEYWLFTATDPSLTAFLWAGLANSQAYPAAVPPYYVCGLTNDTQYWFAINARVNSGPGGPSSPTISATPRYAGTTWNLNAALPQNVFGVGYTSLTTCGNSTTTSAAGSFAAVGGNGAIATSADGMSWTNRTAPTGFSSDLYAVDGYAAKLNNPADPALRWVAVGAGGASVYSTDGVTWANGRAYSLTSPALRSLAHNGTSFVAVGDAGTILSSTDGISWTAYAAGTTANLLGVSRSATIFVAVGDNGTLLTSVDGVTWAARVSGTSSTLRQVSSIGSTYVAVGDNGAVVTSTDGGVTWTAQPPIPGAPSLVSIASQSQLAQSQLVAGATVNPRFIAVASNGNAYTSADGITWSAAVSTGVSALNAIVSTGYGYVAGGNAGATAASF